MTPELHAPDATEEAEEFRAYPKSVQPGIPTLGAVPAGWQQMPMGDLLTVVQRPAVMVDDQSYELVTARRNRGGIVSRGRLTGKQIATKTQFWVRPGDFVMSRRQIAHGACGVLPKALDGALVSNEYAALLPTAKLDRGYLRHLPHSIYFQQTCFHSSIGVHVEKLVFNLDHWLTWPFLVPPLREQQRIAAVLDAWDAAIATTERLVDAHLARKSSLARAVLMSPFESQRLADACEINANTLGANTSPDYQFEYFAIGEDDGEGGWITFEEAPSRARRLAGTGDIIYSMVRPMLRRLFRAVEHESAVYSTGYAVLHPRAGNDGAFIFHCMTTPEVETQIFARLTGSNYPAIGAGDLGDVRIPSLPTEKQITIGAALDVLDRATQIMQLELRFLREQKRGLMQQLLTGKVRVPESIDRLMPPAPPSLEAAA